MEGERKEWFKCPEDIKIHTYCIAGNEMKFLDRFFNSMKEAGCESLSIMVTKSEDGTWEHLQEIQQNDEYWKDKLILEYKEIKPWRFDVARNESMKLCPADADYLFCIDEDEMLEPGFFPAIQRRIFDLGYIPERIYYRYSWSHHPDGTPDRVFKYDKLHGPKGWKWRAPCHEQLILDPQYASLYGPAVCLDEETIWLHHWPDQTKSRGSYLGLLKIRCEENPNDLYSYFYYARELGFVNQWDEALAWFQKLYYRLNIEGVEDDMFMKPVTATEIAKIYSKIGLKEEAETFFKKGIDLDKRIPSSWVEYAQWLAYQGRPEESLKIIRESKKYRQHIEDWRTLPCLETSWKEKQIVADNLCWLEQYEAASKVIEEAKTEIEMGSEQENARWQGFYSDYEWIMKRTKKEQ